MKPMRNLFIILLLVLGSPLILAADSDFDGVEDDVDNCMSIPNADQLDADSDGFGNECDADIDGDSLSNSDEVAIDRDPLVPDYKVSAGFINCAIVDSAQDPTSNTVNCWRFDDPMGELIDWSDKPFSLPQLNNGSRWVDLDGLGDARCGVTQSGSSGDRELHCFSPSSMTGGTKLSTFLESVPTAIQPRLLAVHYFSGCVVDQEAVKCWGDISGSPPGLNPSQVTALDINHSLACVIKADELHCWGIPRYVDVIPQAAYSLPNKKFLSLGGNTICIGNQTTLVCWNASGGTQSTYFISEGHQVNGLAVADYRVCITSDGSLICGNESLGFKDDNGQVNTWFGEGYQVDTEPTLEDPVAQLDAGYRHFCALVSADVKCWGRGGSYQPVGMVPLNLLIDPDRDGITSVYGQDESPFGVNQDDDNDNDGILDKIDNCVAAANVDQADFDFDGIGDACDIDDDNDLVRDDKDAFPFNASEWMDTDNDGVGDNADVFPIDPLDTKDTDNDGLGDNFESSIGLNNIAQDTDGDGLLDAWEFFNGLNPSNASDAILDADGDGILNEDEFILGSNPKEIDTDHDGVDDAAEVSNGTSVIFSNNQLISNERNICVLSDPINSSSGQRIDCWGLAESSIEFRKNQRVILMEGYKVGSGNRSYCAAVKDVDTDAIDIYCDGSIRQRNLTDFVDLDVGFFGYCVIAGNKVSCDDSTWNEKFNALNLRAPSKISIGVSLSCVIDNGYTRCVSHQDYLDEDYNKLLELIPRGNKSKDIWMDVTVTYGVCIDYDGQLKCFQPSYSDFHTPITTKPKYVDISSSALCFISDQDGGSCMRLGSFMFGLDNYQINLPTLLDPKEVVLSRSSDPSLNVGCALDATGLNCWGRFSDFQGNINENVPPPNIYFDPDSDGVASKDDNCAFVNNKDQKDTDFDGQGNACDLDDDGDGYSDADELTANQSDPLDASSVPVDNDGDGVSDVNDTDDDDDMVEDSADNCPLIANTDQTNTDGDAQGDACDADDDGDGIGDTVDPFPKDAYAISPHLLTEEFIVGGLVAVDRVVGVEDLEFSVLPSDNNWWMAEDGSYVHSQQVTLFMGELTQTSNRKGSWTLAANRLWFDTKDTVGKASLVQESKLLSSPNYQQLAPSPAGQIAVRTLITQRWALKAVADGVYTFAVQQVSEEFLLEPQPWAAAIDPDKPVRVTTGPVREIAVLSMSAVVPWTPSELVGHTLALSSIATTVSQVGEYSCSNVGDCADMLIFAADGTGNMQISGRGFNWAIDAQGLLTVTIDPLSTSPQQFEIRRLKSFPRSEHVLVASQNNGLYFARSEGAAYLLGDGDFNSFVEKGIANIASYSFTNQRLDSVPRSAFGWILNPDGTGKNIYFDVSGRPSCAADCSVNTTDMTWAIDGSLVSIDRYDPPESLLDRTRTWQILGMNESVLWVLETLQFEDFFDNDGDGNPDYSVDRYSRVNVYPITPSIGDVDLDGVSDDKDAFVFDGAAAVDADADGMPDDWLAGKGPQDSTSVPALMIDADDDNDGVPDELDAYPLIAISGFVDEDGDGAPDICDADCEALGMSIDPCPDTPSKFGCAGVYPTSVSGTVGDTVTVDVISVFDAVAVEGVEFVFQYDPAVLAVAGANPVVSLPEAATDYSLDSESGVISVAVAVGGSPVEVTAGATLATLSFEVIAEADVAFDSPLIISDVILNRDSAPLVQEGVFSFVPSIDIAGSVMMWAGAVSVFEALDAEIFWRPANDAKSPKVYPVNPSTGQFTGIVSELGGILSAAPTATSVGDGAITAYDAALVLRSRVDSNWVWAGDMQPLLADVDNDGEVLALDAARILRAAVGSLPLPFKDERDDPREYWLVKQAANQGAAGLADFDLSDPRVNLQALDFAVGYIGDVSGNASANESSSLKQSQLRVSDSRVSLDVISGSRLEGIHEVGVYVSGADFYSLDLSVRFEGLALASTPTFVDGWSGQSALVGGTILKLAAARGVAGTGDKILLSSFHVKRNDLRGQIVIELGQVDEDTARVDVAVLNLDSPADTDNDGIPDIDDKCPLTSSDDTLDAVGCTADQRDTDGDGLSDAEETIVYGTNLTVRDTDGDGWSDGEEVEEGTSPTDAASKPEIQGLNIMMICAAIGCGK